MHVGENVLVTVSINTSGTGGVRGPANALAIVLADGVRVPLRSWRFFEAPSSASGSPRPPWGGINGYGTLYNGMIAPLGQYGFRGAVWYQGESNAGAPDDYEDTYDGADDRLAPATQCAHAAVPYRAIAQFRHAQHGAG
ncbi:MAG: hypothetical protein WDM79_11265 [Terricaulis sp.]